MDKRQECPGQEAANNMTHVLHDSPSVGTTSGGRKNCIFLVLGEVKKKKREGKKERRREEREEKKRKGKGRKKGRKGNRKGGKVYEMR